MKLADTFRLFLEVAPRETAIRLMVEEAVVYLESTSRLIELLPGLLPPEDERAPVKTATHPDAIEARRLLAERQRIDVS